MRDLTKLITELDNNLVTKEKDNGDKFVTLKNDNEQHLNIIQAAHDALMPNDYVFEAVDNIINRFMDELDELEGLALNEQQELLQDTLSEVEPEIYTFNQLQWLSCNLNFCFYMQEAIDMGTTNNFFELLTLAHKLFIDETGELLIDALISEIEE